MREVRVSIETPALRRRLNNIYDRLRHTDCSYKRKHFDLLWDLKESALLDNRLQVDVPQFQLEELEQFAQTEGTRGA